MNTRAMAAAILLRIRDHGAYSNVLLPRATRDLSRANQSFVFSLVMGSLRRIRTIDATIEAASGRAVDDLDPEVSAILEIAVGEMLDDDRDTVYATVNESVEAIKQLGFARASGLVNGVLRNLSRNGMPELPGDRARDLSVPEWVLGQITHDHGRQAARELLAGLRLPAPGVGIRVRPGGTVPVDAKPLAGIDDAYRVAQLAERRSGVIVSDGASSAVAQAVAVSAGERVLDMAAAPGGKTLSLWDQGEGRARIVAMDSHGRRLASARDRLARESVSPIWIQADGIHAPFADGVFDAVLVDAPCTGLGTLRRRPEIAMRLGTKSPDSLAATQSALLAEAWRVARPGGRIVYSVCTVFAAETVDIVADYPARPPEGIPGVPWGDGLLMAPHLTETDGMFVAVIEK
ncbi:MAG: methyltransferase domain-containing protein [bacterium]|nr:methyltransferase domain-containing protein [bacterium]